MGLLKKVGVVEYTCPNIIDMVLEKVSIMWDYSDFIDADALEKMAERQNRWNKFFADALEKMAERQNRWNKFFDEDSRLLTMATKHRELLNNQLISTMGISSKFWDTYVEQATYMQKNNLTSTWLSSFSMINQGEELTGIAATLKAISYNQLRDLYNETSFLKNISDVYADYDFSENEDEIALGKHEKEELEDAVNLIVEQPKNWQITLVKYCKIWKERNPALASFFAILFFKFLFPLLVTVGGGLIVAQIITTTPLREYPSPDSSIITKVCSNQDVLLIGDAPYYYEIQYEHIETGEKNNGWVAKRSVALQEDVAEECFLKDKSAANQQTKKDCPETPIPVKTRTSSP